MNILFLGDIVGNSGCSAVKKFLPNIIKSKKINFVVVNGENAAKHITEVRLKDGLFADINDFCSRINLNTVNSGTIESLISSGCFDSISKESRTYNIDNLKFTNDYFIQNTNQFKICSKKN